MYSAHAWARRPGPASRAQERRRDVRRKSLTVVALDRVVECRRLIKGHAVFRRTRRLG